MTLKDAEQIARAGLEIKAIKLNPDNPFTWASGYRMPIYNDNRMFLWDSKNRKLVLNGFLGLFFKHGFYTGNPYDFIAGTSTSGIPWATILTENRNTPMVYVRDKPKDHGLRNQIEGIDAESDLQGKIGILIEDLISTGGSSVAAVQALRSANGVCNHCFSIFTYNLEEAQQMFRAERAYNKEEHKLQTPCNVDSILNYETFLEVAKQTGYINSEQLKVLEEWRTDPFKWGERHGFPKVERK